MQEGARTCEGDLAVELSWVQGLECELQRMRVGLIERQRGRVGGGKEREKGFRRGFSAS